VNARYAAIILAGGFSTRMRRLKALLPLDKATITDHAIATFQNSGIEVFLVVGHRMEEIKQGIIARNITIVDNPDYRKGMFSSVQAGMSRLDKEYRGFFIHPADIPLIRKATINHLAAAAGNHPENIIYPVFRGKRGHPPVIPSSLIPAILGWNSEDGLKGALRSQEKLALEIPVADRNILFDVDTPEDYQELLRRFQFYDLPSDEECEVIYTDICKMTQERVRHCLKVSATAVAIGQALNASGKSIDLELIRKAAILHDIAKGQPKHDIAGGRRHRGRPYRTGGGKYQLAPGITNSLPGGQIHRRRKTGFPRRTLRKRQPPPR
jgi:molybdenum cofactor cytidylyltransferase